MDKSNNLYRAFVSVEVIRYQVQEELGRRKASKYRSSLLAALSERQANLAEMLVPYGIDLQSGFELLREFRNQLNDDGY